ncbi:MAG: class I SAM-dependent methyltransferase [Promethearchaeota archaeon]|nr:MAG: class I SAM-dependent methyltransferase [Candidatus Lokiarchaeota archaeon]
MDTLPSGEDEISIVAKKAFNFLQAEITPSLQYTFLDIGCGTGRDIAFLSSQFANFTFRGIDISQEAIKNALKRAPNKEHITFEQKDWKNIDDTQYDIIYTSGVYHFFPLAERNAFISKIKRILKPNGIFFLSTLSSNDTQYYGKGEPVEGDPNSFQGEFFLHFSSERELRESFGFLEIIELLEYYHKNYAQDTDYHTMRILIAQKN